MGHQGKNEPKSIKEIIACTSAKMAAKASVLQNTPSPARSKLVDSIREADAEFNLSGSPMIPQSGMSQQEFLNHIEFMLQKALR